MLQVEVDWNIIEKSQFTGGSKVPKYVIHVRLPYLHQMFGHVNSWTYFSWNVNISILLLAP